MTARPGLLIVPGGQYQVMISGLRPPRRRSGRSTVVRGGGRNIFAAVLPDTPRGVRIVLDGSFYHEWIVGCADPESVAGQIMAEPAKQAPPA